jgi:1,4-dihydroxy-2-naphthoyl-CoA hydrolase
VPRAASGRLLERVARVQDLAGARHLGYARELDPLHVSHHRDARLAAPHPRHVYRGAIADAATPTQLRDSMPLAVLLGIELLEARAELVRGKLDWAPERCTAGGLIHGGALMALADTCGGVCAFLNLPDGARGTATIESKTNFLRAVRDGAITASTRPLHSGRTMIVVESELAREDGSLVAKVTQSQAFLYPQA